MKTASVKKELERRIGGKKPPIKPRDGFAALLAFYRDVRVDDVDLECDGDMLLFQWARTTGGRGRASSSI